MISSSAFIGDMWEKDMLAEMAGNSTRLEEEEEDY